jgi:hypothetical protein
MTKRLAGEENAASLRGVSVGRGFFATGRGFGCGGAFDLFWAVEGLVSFAARAFIFSMPTLTTPKKSAKPRRVSANRKTTPQVRFPGLVRDPVSGLLVRPLAPGKKPVALSVIEKALAGSL